jgi:DNA-binding FadR family transcriptional regulator
VARQIGEDIAKRGWPVGEILGSEAELMERHSVSRAVLREAVRIVEHHNVARMRRGPKGGLVITKPDGRAVENATALYLRYVGIDREAILAARDILEVAAVEIAAERIDEAGIERLRSALVREGQLGEEGIEQAQIHELHAVIADATGNSAMRLFIEVLTGLEEEMSVAKRSPDSKVTLRRAFEDAHRAHTAIIEAVASGDAALAQHRMRRHLDAIRVFEY